MERFINGIQSSSVLCFYGLADLMDIRPAHRVNTDTSATRVLTGLESKGREWYGLDSLEEVKQAAQQGWSHGVSKIYDALGKVGGDITPVSLKRRLVRADSGDDYDIHRAMAGGLSTAWASRKRQQRVAGGAQVTLAVSLSQSSSADASKVFWRGAAAVRLADIMTASGYQVQVIGYSHTAGTFVDGSGNSTLVEVKAAQAPLDLSTLAAVVALSGVYRHYALWQIHALDKKVESGHGIPRSGEPLVGADLSIRSSDVSDQQSCEKFIKAVVENLNMKAAA